mmetsp:Transcript_50935/g.150154  ORF Transcript_50935/g.150154 Transcript_50935/m.150154 type:complete len:297 (-) Transcript_50935:49-939(-)
MCIGSSSERPELPASAATVARFPILFPVRVRRGGTAATVAAAWPSSSSDSQGMATALTAPSSLISATTSATPIACTSEPAACAIAATVLPSRWASRCLFRLSKSPLNQTGTCRLFHLSTGLTASRGTSRSTVLWTRTAILACSSHSFTSTAGHQPPLTSASILSPGFTQLDQQVASEGSVTAAGGVGRTIPAMTCVLRSECPRASFWHFAPCSNSYATRMKALSLKILLGSAPSAVASRAASGAAGCASGTGVASAAAAAAAGGGGGADAAVAAEEEGSRGCGSLDGSMLDGSTRR